MVRGAELSARGAGVAWRLALALALVAALLAGALASPVPAGATPLTLALDVQGQGLALAQGGVGLQGLGADSRSLAVTIGGPVQAALLYWAGRERPCPQSGGVCVIPSQPYKDQVLRFNGVSITGTVIGTEAQPVSGGGPINNIGYLADVTSIVQAAGTGAQTFTVADGDMASNLWRLDGASLIILYTNRADSGTYRVIVWGGLDVAYGPDPTPGETRVTAPVAFDHGATGGARQAELTIVAGDGTPDRPDRLDISNNPSLFNTLDGSAGAAWDSDTRVIGIPANVGTTAVQLFSEPVGQNPDTLLWQVAALRVAVGQLATQLTQVRGNVAYGDATGSVTARLTGPGGVAVAGATVAFTVGGNGVGSATTNAQGVATLGGVAFPAGLSAGTYANVAVCASYAGDATYTGTGPTCGPLVVGRKVLWLKPADRTVGLRQPNPPAAPPAGCAAQQTPTSACWLELANGSSFAPGDDWGDLNLGALRFSYSRNPPATNASETMGKTYKITAFGAASMNYDIRYQQGTLTVK